MSRVHDELETSHLLFLSQLPGLTCSKPLPVVGPYLLLGQAPRWRALFAQLVVQIGEVMLPVSVASRSNMCILCSRIDVQ